MCQCTVSTRSQRSREPDTSSITECLREYGKTTVVYRVYFVHLFAAEDILGLRVIVSCDSNENGTGAIVSRRSIRMTNVEKLLSINSGLSLISVVDVTASSMLGIVHGWKLGLICVLGAHPPDPISVEGGESGAVGYIGRCYGPVSDEEEYASNHAGGGCGRMNHRSRLQPFLALLDHGFQDLHHSHCRNSSRDPKPQRSTCNPPKHERTSTSSLLHYGAAGETGATAAS